MPAVAILIIATFALSAIMAVAWLVQRATGHDGWADVFWSFGVGTVGALAVLASDDMASPARQYLVAALVTIWSLRLGSHVLSRTLRTSGDPRFAKMRQEWGALGASRMFFFLQSQAFAGAMLVICVYIAAARPDAELEFPDYLGALIMLIALTGEAVADWQLKRFARDPANLGKVCDTGLWAWSRHPNYFFEWFGWISYVLIGADFDGDYAHGWLTLVAPVLMYVLLRHVSGVPPTEEHMLATRGNTFREYQRRTSVFFLRPPAK